MALSAMELQLGVFGMLPTTHAETNAPPPKKKYVHHLLTKCGISCMFIITFRQQWMQVTHAPDKSELFTQEKPEYHQLAPDVMRKMVPILESPV